MKIKGKRFISRGGRGLFCLIVRMEKMNVKFLTHQLPTSSHAKKKKVLCVTLQKYNGTGAAKSLLQLWIRYLPHTRVKGSYPGKTPVSDEGRSPACQLSAHFKKTEADKSSLCWRPHWALPHERFCANGGSHPA